MSPQKNLVFKLPFSEYSVWEHFRLAAAAAPVAATSITNTIMTTATLAGGSPCTSRCSSRLSSADQAETAEKIM
eukprot:CAMPEP_0172828392 /NCGR_PEP_ID=MMETSP1075-20121228/20815_1 /TAXON_ID=2916 /ORGANISM="Ceratium fusus, Strain PA161109" /LENGTH=73 /DNA_ID=CAMNT_0013670383 /DNA_START=1 /DNA_END=219 /DNA_ORIENTATION=+